MGPFLGWLDFVFLSLNPSIQQRVSMEPHYRRTTHVRVLGCVKVSVPGSTYGLELRSCLCAALQVEPKSSFIFYAVRALALNEPCLIWIKT